MNTRKALALAGLVGVVCMGTAVVAGDEKAPDMDAMMEAWMKYADPGEHHQHLAKMVGTWSVENHMWPGPDAPEIVSTGVAKNEMILDGRFLQSNFEGEFQGQPFHGMALDGYDNLQKKHVGMWMDTMGTMVMSFEGDCDQDGKVRTMIAEYKDAVTGKMTKMKSVTTIVSNDKFTYESYSPGPDGEFFKSMEIVYTRQ